VAGEEFINFYLKDKEEELKSKWKIVSFLEDEIEDLEKETTNNKQNYYSISKLKEILKNKKNVAKN